MFKGRRLPALLDGTFFTVVREVENKIVARCEACPNKELSGFWNSTSNFLRHLKSEHASLFNDYVSHKHEKSEKRRVSAGSSSSQSIIIPPKKRKSLAVECEVSRASCNQVAATPEPLSSTTPQPHRPNQTKVDNLIYEYIVKSTSPLTTVENNAFVALVTGLAPGSKVMSVKSLSDRINANYTYLTCEVRDRLKAAEVVCTTADVWSVNEKSFLGMTVHWLSASLERMSAVLACCRFVGPHTYDRIARVICEIYQRHDLEFDKIITLITDNVSNKIKTSFEFRNVEDSLEQIKEEYFMEIGHEEERLNERSDSMNAEYQQNQCGLFVQSIGDVMASTDESSMNTQLPLHARSVCHGLNLLATKDAEDALENAAYSRLYHACMTKCQAFWNAIRKCKTGDKIAGICINKKLLVPAQSSWNAKYHAISRLLEPKDKLNQVTDALQLTKFCKNEIDFLMEYKSVMEPLAVTYDQLQNDKDCYYGMFLPKLIQLKYKLQKIKTEKSLLLCSPLVCSLLQGLVKRFEQFFGLKVTDPCVREAVLAALSHPCFKLRWVPPSERDAATLLLVNTLRRMNEQLYEAGTSDGESFCMVDDYGYGETSTVPTGKDSIQIQVISYLSDADNSMKQLETYSLIKKVFVRYNTSIPSSSLVRKLFSSATFLETSCRRNKLSDAMFEKLTLLKLNECFD